MPTHLFHCSACGAPLIPRGSTTVISCPYCHASVIVPEDLRQTAGEGAWSTWLFDGFTTNENNWLVGQKPSEYFAKLNQTIAEGRYRWEAQVSLPSSLTTAWLPGYYVSDFHLLANGKHVLGSKAGSSWGVLFRIQDNQNFYWFRITDRQFFAISVVKEGQWQNLVEWTKADAIKSQGVNQLEVIAHGAHFTCLINGQIVSEVDDDHFSQGLIGLAIEAYTVGEETIFDFLDITLRAP